VNKLKQKYSLIIYLFILLNIFSIPDFSFASKELGDKIVIQNQCNSSLPNSACAATSLSMILSAFGIERSIENMIEEAGTNSNGTFLTNSLSVIKKYLPASRFIRYSKIEDIKELLNDGLIQINLSKGTQITNLLNDRTYASYGHASVLTHFDEQDNAHIVDPYSGVLLVGEHDFFNASGLGIFVTEKKVLPPQFYTYLNMPSWLFENENSLYINNKKNKDKFFNIEIAKKDNNLTQTGDSACAMYKATCEEVILIGGKSLSCKDTVDSAIVLCKKDGYRETFDTNIEQYIEGASWYDLSTSTNIHSPYSACKKLSHDLYPYKVWDKNGIELKSSSCDFMGENFSEGTVLCKTYPEEIFDDICKVDRGEQCESFMEGKINENKSPLITPNGVDWCPSVRNVFIELYPEESCYPFNKEVNVNWTIKGYDKCIASGAWSGDKTAGGYQSVYIKTDLNNLSSNTDLLILDCEYRDSKTGSIVKEKITKTLKQNNMMQNYNIKLSLIPDDFLNIKELPFSSKLSWSATDNGVDCDSMVCNIKGPDFLISTSGCSISGEKNLDFNEPGEYKYMMSCIKKNILSCNNFDEYNLIRIIPTPLPVVDLNVNPNPSFGEGGSVFVDIQWDSKYADTCKASWTDENIATSSVYIWSTNKNGKYNFSVTCTNFAGDTTKTVKDIEMYLKPEITLATSPENVNGFINVKIGEPVKIKWNVENADYCSTNFGVNGNINSGEQIIIPSELSDLNNSNFSVTCMGLGGSDTKIINFVLNN
jgi:hypothetical protein